MGVKPRISVVVETEARELLWEPQNFMLAIYELGENGNEQIAARWLGSRGPRRPSSLA